MLQVWVMAEILLQHLSGLCEVIISNLKYWALREENSEGSLSEKQIYKHLKFSHWSALKENQIAVLLETFVHEDIHYPIAGFAISEIKSLLLPTELQGLYCR